MGGTSINYNKSKGRGWTQLFDLLDPYQRRAQQDVIGGGMGAFEDAQGWLAQAFPGLTSGQQMSLEAMETRGMENVDYFTQMRDAAAKGTGRPEFQNYLNTTVDAPLQRAATVGRDIFGAEAAGLGHYGRDQSTDVSKGMNRQEANLLNAIATGRANATMGEQARQDQLGMAATQGIMSNIGAVNQMQAQERDAALQALAYQEQFRQNKLNSILAALGLVGQIGSSVGKGTGGFSNQDAMGWGASAQVG